MKKGSINRLGFPVSKLPWSKCDMDEPSKKIEGANSFGSCPEFSSDAPFPEKNKSSEVNASANVQNNNGREWLVRNTATLYRCYSTHIR